MEADAIVGLGRPTREEGASWALRQKGRPGRPERLGSSLPLFALFKNNRKRKKREEKKKVEKEFGHGNKFPGLAKNAHVPRKMEWAFLKV